MSEFETITVDVQNIQVSVRKKGTGPPLLFLHGAFGYEGWPKFLDLFSEHFTVYAPIHPGFLESEGIEKINDLYDLVLFNLDLVDTLELDNPHIVGHYFGAMIAAEIASVCSHNLGKLVIANPAGFWIDEDPGLDYFIVPDNEISKHLLAHPDDSKYSDIFPEIDDESEQDQRSIDKVKALSTVAKFLWPVPDKGLSRRITRVRCETLVVTSEKDPIVPVSHGEKASSLIKNSEHITLQGVGHLAPLEDPENFVTYIRNFLN